MGFRILLIAIEGKERDKIFEEYGVKGTNTFEEVPESDVVISEVNDYTLLFINDEILPDDELFKRLSVDANLMALYVHETVMNSLAVRWRNGIEIWSVLHDFQENAFHLDPRGRLPESFEKIKNRQIKLQQRDKDVDHIFDVPVQLFDEIVGFRYDSFGEDDKWEILERISLPKEKSWWDIFS